MVIHVEVLPCRKQISTLHTQVDELLSEWSRSRGDVAYVNEHEYAVIDALRSMLKERQSISVECSVKVGVQVGDNVSHVGCVVPGHAVPTTQIRYAAVHHYEATPHIYREAFEFVLSRAFASGLYRGLSGGKPVVVLMSGSVGPRRQFEAIDDYELLRVGERDGGDGVKTVKVQHLCAELDEMVAEV